MAKDRFDEHSVSKKMVAPPMRKQSGWSCAHGLTFLSDAGEFSACQRWTKLQGLDEVADWRSYLYSYRAFLHKSTARGKGEALTDPVRVWFRIMRFEARVRQTMGSRLRELGLSIAQTDVLSVLTEREGLSQQELAERLYVTKGNISGLIDRLAAAGYVERRSLASDRRSHALYLTQAGQSLALKAIEAQKKFVHQTLGQINPCDLEEFERILQDLRDQVRKLATQTDVCEEDALSQAPA